MKIPLRNMNLLVIAVLAIAGIAIVTGCCLVTSSYEGNIVNASEDCESANLTLPEVYTEPIGGFNRTLFWGVDPESSFETGYTFYSRNYSGEVRLTTSASENLNLTIEPSTFTVEPDHTYVSRVSISTGPGFDTKSVSLKVTMANNSHHFGDDAMTIYAIIGPGLIWVHQDHISIENNEIVIKKGECYQYNLTYQRGSASEQGQIQYSLSETPLNMKIIPSQFIARHGVASPSKIILHANSSIRPGIYQVNISVNGVGEWLYIYKDDGSWDTIYASDEKVIPLKIRVE